MLEISSEPMRLQDTFFLFFKIIFLVLNFFGLQGMDLILY